MWVLFYFIACYDIQAIVAANGGELHWITHPATTEEIIIIDELIEKNYPKHYLWLGCEEGLVG